MEKGAMRSTLEFLQVDCVHLRIWSCSNYAAPYWRLYWNPTPGAHVVTPEKTFPLDPRTIMLIAPETTYAGKLTTTVQHLYLHFLVGTPYAQVHPGVFPFRITPPERAILQRLSENLQEKTLSPEWEMQATALIAATLCRLPESCRIQSTIDPRIEACMLHLQEHLEETVSNDELARLAAMNTNAFIRLFEENVGQSPQRWFRARRIEQSCILLHHSGQSIEQIALSCGFCDRYHFSRVFRQLRGTSPAAFRRAKFHG